MSGGMRGHALLPISGIFLHAKYIGFLCSVAGYRNHTNDFCLDSVNQNRAGMDEEASLMSVTLCTAAPSLPMYLGMYLTVACLLSVFRRQQHSLASITKPVA